MTDSESNLANTPLLETLGKAQNTGMHVSILNFSGALESAVYGLSEILAIGNQAAKSIGVNHRVSFAVIEISEAKPPNTNDIGEVLFVPPLLDAGGLGNPNQQFIADWLAQFRTQPTTVNGCCSGVLLMADAGLLDGKQATTTWWLIDQLSTHSQIDVQANAMLVDAGDVITSSGPYSYLYHGLHIIERFLGPDVARLTAKLAVVEPGRPMNGIFAIPSVISQSDPFMVKFQEITIANLESGVSVEQLAKALHVSPRTLHRRVKEQTGLSPSQLVSEIRIEVAKTLLETTSEAIAVIAAKVGFEDTSSFRTAFSRKVGTTPTAYRSRMNLNPPSKIQT